jgi:hypothetical protein
VITAIPVILLGLGLLAVIAAAAVVAAVVLTRRGRGGEVASPRDRR